MNSDESLQEFAGEMYEALCVAFEVLNEKEPCHDATRAVERLLRRIEGCELRECPFCGSEHVREYKDEMSEPGEVLYGVMCADCKGSSGMSDTPDGARENWNRRERV